MSTMTGGCMCSRIRYTAQVESDDAYLCHCRMCQRWMGNVSVALFSLEKRAVSWEREPDYFASSPIARRGFCSACGTSLSFDYPDSPKMDLTVASFDEPGRFRPKHNFGVESRLHAWDDVRGLPEMRSEDYAPLQDRWARAGAHPAS